jgi:hypothetical protein
MTLVTDGLVVGVDTHKDVHVAVVLDRLGRRLAVREFPATDAGNTQLAGCGRCRRMSTPMLGCRRSSGHTRPGARPG